MSERGEPPLSIAGEALASLRPYRAHPDPAPVKLDANESPWALPDAARRRIAEVLAAAPLHRYPDGRAEALRAALSDRLGARPDELVLGVGSDEVIGILLSAFDRPRGGADKPTLAFPTPTFVMYSITSRVLGFEPVEVPLAEDFALDADAMCEAIDAHRPNLVFLASPNNPTGNAFDEAAMRRVIEAAPNALVVIDEAYAPFVGRSANAWVGRYANVGVMGTLSKIGLAGLRVGWIRMHPRLADEAEKARAPYNLSVPAQLAATLALTELGDVLDDGVRQIVRARESLGAAMAEIDGLRVLPSDANFFLVQVEDAASTHAALLERGVQVRHFAKQPRLANFLRITVGTPAENATLLETLRALSLAPNR